MQNNFLLSEIRCEFLVSEKRKKIWKIQLDLIEQLERVCKKYGLRYYASNGTLLGAVRHEGFVPWDDDVDIVMPRPDYKILIAVAEKEFEAPLFLQTAMNEPGYYRNYIRLRNCNTSAIPLKDINHNTHNGIFIDIFPMDGCFESRLIGKWQHFLLSVYFEIANTHVYYPDFQKYIFFRKGLFVASKFYCKLFGYYGFVQRIEKLRSRASYDDSKNIQVITHGNRCLIFPRKYFENVEMVKFEYLRLPVPNEYDKILKSHYGNYMELPPKEERGQHHKIFFDPDKSYTEYIGTLTREEAEKKLNNY